MSIRVVEVGMPGPAGYLGLQQDETVFVGSRQPQLHQRGLISIIGSSEFCQRAAESASELAIESDALSSHHSHADAGLLAGLAPELFSGFLARIASTWPTPQHFEPRKESGTNGFHARQRFPTHHHSATTRCCTDGVTLREANRLARRGGTEKQHDNGRLLVGSWQQVLAVAVASGQPLGTGIETPAGVKSALAPPSLTSAQHVHPYGCFPSCEGICNRPMRWRLGAKTFP